MSKKETSAGGQVLNAVKFIADVSIIPGSSQLIEGSVGSGLAYGVAGLAAKAIFGPWLLLGVGLDSYSKSASGKHLWQLFGADEEAEAPAITAAEPVKS
jgi:hypothetical protein